MDRAPLSVEFSGQEYWSGLPFSTPLIYVCVCVCVYICKQIHSFPTLLKINGSMLYITVHLMIYLRDSSISIQKDLS